MKKRAPKLSLSRMKAAPARAGVYEDTYAFPGTNAFNVYRADGARIGRWEAPAGVTDEELLAAFDKLLERTDPPPKLKLL